MSLTPLEVLVKETRHAFIIAKADGVLDAGEVIQIAADLAQKVQKIAGLAGSEKKAMLLLTLKKGLEDSGGLDSLVGFVGASKEAKQVFEDNLMMAASSAVDLVLAAASGKLDLQKSPLEMVKACLPACISAVKVLLPKDQVLLQEAAKYSEGLLKNGVSVAMSAPTPAPAPAPEVVVVAVAVAVSGPVVAPADTPAPAPEAVIVEVDTPAPAPAPEVVVVAVDTPVVAPAPEVAPAPVVAPVVAPVPSGEAS